MRAPFALLIFIAAAPSKADILPVPQKLTEDFGFTCLMLSERLPVTSLSVSVRYEPITGKNDFYRVAYWWTLSSDSDRFPSNRTFMNMRSLELDQPTSTLSFQTANGWTYSYGLYYAIEERFPSFFYVPDHLVVRRRRTGDSSRAIELVGMGECRLNQTKPVQ